MKSKQPTIRPKTSGNAKELERVLDTLERIERQIETLSQAVFSLVGPRPAGSPILHARIPQTPDARFALGSAYRALRKQRGLSLEDVADVAPVSRSSLANFETGKGQMDQAQLEGLLKVLGVESELIDDMALDRLEASSPIIAPKHGATSSDFVEAFNREQPQSRRARQPHRAR